MEAFFSDVLLQINSLFNYRTFTSIPGNFDQSSSIKIRTFYFYQKKYTDFYVVLVLYFHSKLKQI